MNYPENRFKEGTDKDYLCWCGNEWDWEEDNPPEGASIYYVPSCPECRLSMNNGFYWLLNNEKEEERYNVEGEKVIAPNDVRPCDLYGINFGRAEEFREYSTHLLSPERKKALDEITGDEEYVYVVASVLGHTWCTTEPTERDWNSSYTTVTIINL